ncbi:MAG: histidine-type phosphatase, partial [Bacteroidales bacterium]|nr:histidine-type phosphatase [Bacteroidales bacterium]
MKRCFLAAGLILIAASLASAQTFNVDELVGDNRDLAASGERAYDFDVPALTPAPEGYKPFYISHYGRHGSR